MEDLLFEYADTFGENFPMFLFRSTDEKQIKAIIKKCLEDGEPYEPDIKDDAKY